MAKKSIGIRPLDDRVVVEPLDPTVKDEFVPAIRQNHDNRIFKFLRNEQNQVAGLSVTLWRVKGVSFTKAMP